MVKMLTYSVWLEHPNAVKVRAVFGYVTEPTAAEFEGGKRKSYEVLSAYDFVFDDQTMPRSP